jgi:hypothetical protein
MNEEAKRLWVAALRSGKYDQTTGALRDGVGYCCLGVLCEVAIEAGVPVQVYHGEEDELASYDGHVPAPVRYGLGRSYRL